MKLFVRIGLTVILMMWAAGAWAQTTKVRGRITDEEGEGIPFAGVYFKGTTVGITTDMDGWYNLENKHLSDTVLVAQILGYDTKETVVRPGQFSNVDFVLKLTDNRLTGARVKADNKRAKALLANIQKNRYRNDPENHPAYTSRIYNKMELDLTHPQEQLDFRSFRKNFGFVFDYIDTSSVSGVPYLPVMISETLAERRHRRSPELDSETILANRMSGIDPDANNLLSQFTGSMHLKVNFYQPYINAFDVLFPSPIIESGMMFYNYFIIDSTIVDGRKTLLVRYHPKALVSTPAFDGEMRIDAEDYAIRSIHANMKNTTNVNWLKNLVLDAEYQRMEDSTWFYKSDSFYADLALSMRDSSKLLSFIARRETQHLDVEFTCREGREAATVKVAPDASSKEAEFWAEVRPSPLSEKEENVYEMVDRIKTVPVFNTMYDIIYTLVNGYLEIGKISIGPYNNLYSHNNMEGARPQFGIRTSPSFSKKDRLTAYIAYGIRDHTFKGGGKWEHLWSRDPERKLTVNAKYDVYQLGSGLNSISQSSLFGTLLGGGHSSRLCMMSGFSVNYRHEFSMRVNAEAGVDLRRYYPVEKAWVPPVNQVPMYRPDGTAFENVASNEMYVSLRFCKNDVVSRGLFTKSYLHSDYPAITVTLAGSVPGLRKNDYGYLRPEISMRWSPRVPPFGISRLYMKAGTIVGTVPYPFLHLHEGNSTWSFDRTSFACMDYMEFVSDSWFTVYYNHCFNGFFLGYIPLIRRLGLREEFSFKMAYGALSDKNNGDITAIPAEKMKAPMVFPYGSSALGKVPYVELGAGISNILKLFRVDCFWRVTHRNERTVVIDSKSEFGQKVLGKLKTSNFAVTVGAEFKF